MADSSSAGEDTPGVSGRAGAADRTQRQRFGSGVVQPGRPAPSGGTWPAAGRRPPTEAIRRARGDLIERLAVNIRWGAPAGVVVAGCLSVAVPFVGSDPDHRVTGLAAAFALLCGSAWYLANRLLRSERTLARPDERVLAIVLGLVGAVFGAFTVASLTVLAPATAPDDQLIVAATVLGCTCAFAVLTAPSQLGLVALAGAMVTVECAGFALADSAQSVPLAGVVLIGGATVVALHQGLHPGQVRAAITARRGEVLAADLEATNVRLMTTTDLLEAANRELSELKDRSTHKAHHDGLTGLANRNLFTVSVGRAVLDPRSITAVVIIDLDNFKVVNDTVGRQAGNELLQAVAGRLGGGLRGGDTLARLDGDEFGALMPHVRTVETALEVAGRLHACFSTPFVIDGYDITVTASVGVAYQGHLDQAPADLLSNAQVALRRAKGLGGDRIEVFGRAP